MDLYSGSLSIKTIKPNGSYIMYLTQVSSLHFIRDKHDHFIVADIARGVSFEFKGMPSSIPGFMLWKDGRRVSIKVPESDVKKFYELEAETEAKNNGHDALPVDKVEIIRRGFHSSYYAYVLEDKTK